jgi:hypothetical protein
MNQALTKQMIKTESFKIIGISIETTKPDGKDASSNKIF